MKQQRWIAVLLSILLIVACPVMALAHSGRTDASGGHKDNKNKSGLGSYHYHCGGYSAHLHEGGVCPYTGGGDVQEDAPEEEPEEERIQYPTSVEVHCDAQQLQTGESVSASAQVSPAEAEFRKITWKSSNKSVATVDRKGKIKALAPGKVTITATAEGGVESSFSLKITEPKIEKLQVSEPSQTLLQNEKLQLKLVVTPKTANTQGLLWSSDNGEIATVSDSGAVTGKKPGTATITVTGADGVQASCKVEVRPIPVSGLQLQEELPDALQVGDSVQLKIRVLPENTGDQTLTYESENPEIAQVDETGLITAKAQGTATIQIVHWDISREVVVRVLPGAAARVEINGKVDRLKKGEAIALSASVYPEDAAGQEVVWTADPPEAVELKDGKLTAKKTGTVVVTATADNQVADQFEIEIAAEPPGYGAAVVVVVGILGIGAYLLAKKKGILPNRHL